MKKAILTGPTGTMGAALTAQLLSEGVEVTAVCRPGTKRLDSIPLRDGVELRFCQLDALPELAGELPHDYDAFFHFGWDGSARGDRQNLRAQVRNVGIALDAAELADRLGCEVFVGAGSHAEYGEVRGGVFSQDTPAFPTLPYGIAKLAAGQVSRARCRQLGVRHIWTRILTVYGPHINGDNVLIETARALMQGRSPSLTAGEQIWDYLYCKDAARAFSLLSQQGRDGEIYCLGTGEARPLRYYLETVKDILGSDIPLGLGEIPYAAGQSMREEADISLLREHTGFKPLYSFRDGMSETIDWLRQTNKWEV